MKHYVFMISTNEKSMLTVGWCKDILKAIKFYKELPNLSDSPDVFNKLVYVEEHPNEDSCVNRFNELMGFTVEVKEIVIASVNPNFIELIPGLNFDLI